MTNNDSNKGDILHITEASRIENWNECWEKMMKSDLIFGHSMVTVSTPYYPRRHTLWNRIKFFIKNLGWLWRAMK
jgi:hypothetical protein